MLTEADLQSPVVRTGTVLVPETAE
jgi:hypothetical protein